ncbi:hypothetical protein ACFQJC_08055 [Haloferax namakaokahaiae]|uniref:t-SNARE coiled-coil homology domain-containing protein n=1 Tax=Haloferax namakaokahaiae TaxID=1748331 RepID=A0ABD5ZE29_9EURY
MSHSSEEVVSVSDGDVTVDKAYTADEFPVPAIKFEISSTFDEEARIRIIDRIPESFPMESVGFHPDFESENWTAYKDHRVEYERTLEPGEDLVTVYGIRLTDGESPDSFLTEPTLERVPVDDGLDPDDIDDILGEDRSQLVRDVLAGNRDPIRADEAADDGAANASAGPSDEDLASTFGRTDEGEPAAAHDDAEILDDDGDSEDVDADHSDDAHAEVLDTDEDAPADPEESVSDEDEDAEVAADDEQAEAEAEPVDETDDATETDAPAEADAPAADEPIALGGDDAEDADDSADDDGYVDAEQALIDAAAEEVESEVADDADDSAGDERAIADDEEPSGDYDSSPKESVSRDDAAPAADPHVEGSLAAALAAEIRDGSVDDDDLEALRDAVATEEQRTTDVRISHLQSRVSDLAAYSDALAEFIDDEGTGEELIEGFRAELADVKSDIDALDTMVDDAVETVDDSVTRIDSIEETLADVDARADRTEYRLTDLDQDFEEHADRLDDHDETFDEFAERLDEQEDRIETASNHIQAGSNRLDSVEASISEHGEELDSVEQTLAEQRDSLESVEQTLDEHGETIDSVEQTVAEYDTELDSLREQLDDFDARVSDVLERLDSVESNASEAQETAANLHAEVGEIREDIASLDGDVVDARKAIEADVEDLKGDVDDLNEAVAELDTFRERLAGAFGTGMGGAPDEE